MAGAIQIHTSTCPRKEETTPASGAGFPSNDQQQLVDRKDPATSRTPERDERRWQLSQTDVTGKGSSNDDR